MRAPRPPFEGSPKGLFQDGADQQHAAARAAATYDAASDHYLDEDLSFWDRFGRASVERLGPLTGARVLDLCCGAGASALEAARRVGPRGRVVAVDVSPRLLDQARSRAQHEGLTNLDFLLSDATRLDVADATFDAVVCVFGVFFAADRTSFVREMGRLAKPGGLVALTTWGADLFEPANSIFWDAVGARRPELRRSFNPWDDLVTPDDVAALFDEHDFNPPHVERVQGTHRLASPQGFWNVALGSGYRATLEAMSDDDVNDVRGRALEVLEANAVVSITTNVIYAVATRRESTQPL